MGEIEWGHGCLPIRDLDPAVSSRGLRLDPHLVATQEDEQTPLGPGMLHRDAHELLDELMENHLAREGLRGLDHGLNVQLPDRGADCGGSGRGKRFFMQARIAFVE